MAYKGECREAGCRMNTSHIRHQKIKYTPTLERQAHAHSHGSVFIQQGVQPRPTAQMTYSGLGDLRKGRRCKIGNSKS